MDGLSVLRESRMFAGVPDTELAPLVRASRPFDIAPGQPLWLQGDPAHALYIVGEGHLKAYRLGEAGQQIVLWFFGPGDSTGEPALFLPAATRGTASEAVERTSGLAIEGKAVLTFLDTHPAVARRVMQRLSEMLWDSPTMPSEVLFVDVPVRVARKLLDLATVHGVEMNGSTRIEIRISQGTLAGMIAASRENVNRALAPLISERIVAHHAGYFSILDMSRLRVRAQ